MFCCASKKPIKCKKVEEHDPMINDEFAPINFLRTGDFIVTRTEGEDKKHANQQSNHERVLELQINRIPIEAVNKHSPFVKFKTYNLIKNYKDSMFLANKEGYTLSKQPYIDGL